LAITFAINSSTFTSSIFSIIVYLLVLNFIPVFYGT
jgi:hypothetical protein